MKRGAMLRAGLGVGVGFDAAQAERLPADNADSLMRHKAPLLVGRVGGPLDGRITIWYDTLVLRLPASVPAVSSGSERSTMLRWGPCISNIYQLFVSRQLAKIQLGGCGHPNSPQFPGRSTTPRYIRLYRGVVAVAALT